MPFLDVEYREAPAVTMGRWRIELARAAICAIAIAELAAFDLPRGHVVIPLR
jgi:hypothetical protein